MKGRGPTVVDISGKPAQPGDGMLVVQCSITPEAAREQAFDKLLDANGIALQDSRGPTARTDVAQSVANRMQQQVIDGNAKQKPGADVPVRPATVAGEVDFFYVEATPEQITNTLNGLSSQPEVFQSVSLSAEPDGATPSAIVPEVVRQQIRDSELQSRPLVAGMGVPSDQPPSLVLHESEKGEAASSAELKTLSAVPLTGHPQRTSAPTVTTLNGYGGRAAAAEQQSAAARSAAEQPRRAMQSALGQIQSPPKSLAFDGRLSQSQQMAQALARQRVLFVLKVVDGNASKPANVQKMPAANAAKSGQPAYSPADAPAKKK